MCCTKWPVPLVTHLSPTVISTLTVTSYSCSSCSSSSRFHPVFPNSSNTSTSASHELRDVSSVAALQDQAQLTLNKYIAAVYPGQQALRFGKLLLALPPLRAVSGTSIEELFFRKTIGNIAIVRLLSDMYKSSDF